MKSSTFCISALLALCLPLRTLAHFKLTYPTWRGDSLSETNTSISQWIYPCANLSPSQQRTPWPLTGGPVLLDLHHPWTYLFVNLGFGTYVTNFNVSLNPDGGRLVNETGNGTFCWSVLPLPDVEILGVNVVEGMEASIQVVTVGDSGSALYNCADIIFTSNATLLPSNQCVNSTGVSAAVLGDSAQASNTTSGTNHSGSGSEGTSSSGATGLATSSSGVSNLLMVVLAAVVGAVVA